MKIIKMIPSDKRDSARCYFCGTNKSVKYLVRLKEPMFSKASMLVCCCNKCVAMNYEN